MSIAKKFQRAYHRTGLVGTARLIVVNLLRLPSELLRKPTKTWFDEQYGVDTDRWAALSDFEIDSPNHIYGQEYAPIAVQLFRDALAKMNIDFRRFTFIDLGSGKGRALLLAAAYPFRKIIGVEFIADLHRIALENLRLYRGPRSCLDVQPVCMDATRFEFPDEPLVIFLYNPFIGPTMQQVIARIEDTIGTHRREVYVLYAKPLLAGDFRKSSRLMEIETDQHYCIFRSRQVPEQFKSTVNG